MIKLFVVGFPREIDEMQLAQLFGPYGNIQLLTIARDQISGKSKGFGFIQMDDKDAYRAIEALNGYMFGDRQMEVRAAEEKPEPAKQPPVQRKTNYIPVTANSPVRKKRPRLSK